MSDLNDQTVIVTGGTSGIGRAIAETFADEGASVVPTSRIESHVVETADELSCKIVCPTDVRSREEVKHLFQTVTDRLGEVNVLINSAGIFFDETPISEFSDREWQDIMQTNLYGTFVTSQLAPKFMGGDNRAIVNISSIGGHLPLRNQPTYTASKYGVNGLTESFAVEYASRNIRVNGVAPGYEKLARIANISRT